MADKKTNIPANKIYLIAKNMRKEKGYTQDEFSKKFGVPLTTIKNIDRGQNVTLGSLATYLGHLDLDLKIVEK